MKRAASSVMKFPSVAFLCCISLCSVLILVFCESMSANDKCESLGNGPFNICTSAGYNYTLPLPKKLTEPMKNAIAETLRYVIPTWENCSDLNLAATMECAFTFPKCGNNGTRVLPCRRVCGQFLKQCMDSEDEFSILQLELLLTWCLSLPDEEPGNDKCYEPPNLNKNDSTPSPLDRGCQELIIPACKELGLYSHTLFSELVQKRLYKLLWSKPYNESDLTRDFPEMIRGTLEKHPMCQENIKKLYCGWLFPPCYVQEVKPVLKTTCRWVCEDIAKDCPHFFRGPRAFYAAEYCGSLPEGNRSEVFCDEKEWPSPFHWLDHYLVLMTPSSSPSEEPGKQRPRGWAIAVAVVSSLVIAGLVLGGLIWWKWRRTSTKFVGYEKQHDEAYPEQ